MRKRRVLSIICSFMGLSSVFVLNACASGLHPVTPSDILGGGPAIETTLLVKHECSLSAGGREFRLPVGEYRPIHVDAHGVLYAAPGGVQTKRGDKVWRIPGGIHFPNSAGQYYSFLSMWVALTEGDVSKLRLPTECAKPDGSNVSLTRNGREVHAARPQSSNVLPKYGSQPKDEAQQAADREFIAAVDEQYKGNRKSASKEIAERGWQFLRQGKTDDAMRRFNQAWLLDGSNGQALWGMAVIQGNRPGGRPEALKLFAEAEEFVSSDLDFYADYGLTLGIFGAQTRDESLVKKAFVHFARVYEKAPQHTLNLQGWAMTLFLVGDYAEAWRKIGLAEATTRGGELDPKFIAALQSKMPRPSP
ncbi:MAG: tetratricopeptide repeat protein [candidate division NC10 bacterium]|nr:tetratricopeptide repeat protein [candidate division NC10 bacterium]